MAKLPARSRRKEGAYSSGSVGGLQFIPSGAAVLDCAGTGGLEKPGAWPLGRMVNIIGDKSTGKTLLAIEACANFLNQFPKGKVWYRESEAAFDKAYAEGLGLPLDKVCFWEDDHSDGSDFNTVEDMFEDLDKILKTNPQCGLYIVDSMDALSDRASDERKIDEGGYEMTKQKQLGKFFKNMVRRLKRSKICLLIVSQVRVDINARFGQKLRRNGGKSLDFYASYCVWLARITTLKRTIKGIERAYGVRVRARFEKNKVAAPFRECEFDILFNFGVDDLGASLDWLEKEAKDMSALGVKSKAEFMKKYQETSPEEYREVAEVVASVVREKWREVDKMFDPPFTKYAKAS